MGKAVEMVAAGDVAVPRALILAAGVGRRLATGDGRPKSLLTFDGRSLIARHLDILRACGVTDITVVVGFGAEHLRAEAGSGVSFVGNPDFREGSVVSLWAGRDVLRSGQPVVLMDADVIYDARLMRRLLDSTLPNVLLLDREIEAGDEPVKLCVSAAGRIVDFRKRPEMPYDWYGESVGFFRLAPATARDLADRAESYVTGGRRSAEYEEPIRDMILTDAIAAIPRFGFEDISGLPWTEIDFPEDVGKAEALLPELAA